MTTRRRGAVEPLARSQPLRIKTRYTLRSVEALQPVPADGLDALASLESDCMSWGLLEPNRAILAVKEVYKSAYPYAVKPARTSATYQPRKICRLAPKRSPQRAF